MRAKVLAVGEPSVLGAMRKVRGALESDPRIELEGRVGAASVEEQKLRAGSTCSFTLAHNPDGTPDIDEWRGESK